MESALLLRLLEREGMARPEQARIARFLARHRSSADAFDRILVECALRGTLVVGQDTVEEILLRSPSALHPRKQALIATILAIFDRRLPEQSPEVETIDTQRLHIWASVQMTAIKVILCRAREKSSSVSDTEIEVLKATQRSRQVWEGNILVNLFVLHALAGDPGNAALVRAGIGKVLQHQRGDGGLPFVGDTDTWCTINAAMALATAGAPRAQLDRIAGYLLSQQRADGLWAYSEHTTQTDLDDSSVCVKVLQAVNQRHFESSIHHGLGSIAAMQGTDGGFPTYAIGAPSEAYITAAAINALGAGGDRYSKQISDGVKFLVAAQGDDGTFGPDWSRSRFHTIARVIAAAAQLGDSLGGDGKEMVDRALEAVLSGQSGDGGWGQQPGQLSDAISTAYALLALDHHCDRGPVFAGVEFLLRSRGPDGSIVSVPDMVGPRPFVIDVPILADIYALLALGHAASHVPQTRPRPWLGRQRSRARVRSRVA